MEFLQLKVVLGHSEERKLDTKNAGICLAKEFIFCLLDSHQK